MTDTPTLFGVIGTGTISSAVVTGCLTPSDKSGGKTFNCKFIVSARSAAKSEALRKRFPESVTVEADNQGILDACSYVIISVLPKQAREVLNGLRFDPARHVVLSLMAAVSGEEIAALARLPLESVCRAIPLPSVARHCGTTLVTRADSFPLFRDLFRHTGVCQPVADDRELNVLMTVSSTMGPFYYSLAAMRDFVTSRGVARQTASGFIAATYLGLARDAHAAVEANADGFGFDALIAEQTPGGLNEAAIRSLHEAGVGDAYARAMGRTLDRLEGASDTST